MPLDGGSVTRIRHAAIGRQPIHLPYHARSERVCGRRRVTSELLRRLGRGDAHRVLEERALPDGDEEVDVADTRETDRTYHRVDGAPDHDGPVSHARVEHRRKRQPAPHAPLLRSAPMPCPARAALDPRLHAVVVARRPLLYTTGAEVKTDRPAHVRAGSGLTRVGARFVVVQDDASFFAVLAPDGTVSALPLTYAPGGARQFDEGRKNKSLKLDLEACATLPDGRVLAFGSGSTQVREHVVLVSLGDDGAQEGEVTVLHVPELYDALRAEARFSGSELNLEGAAVLAALGTLRLFQRGNGAPIGARAPVDATCELPLDALLRYLEAPTSVAPPPLREIVQWELGAIDATRLTFTDACAESGRLFFLAAAEASPNAYDDGPVAGVVLGVTANELPHTSARWARIVDEHGAPLRAKGEGLAFDPEAPDRALVVLDRDDPERPTELCTLRLDGPWREPA